MQPIVFNQTFTSTIQNFAFGNLPQDILKELFKDGRVFAHFIESLLAQDYGLTRIIGCKDYDLVDPQNPETKYEQKTFTRRECAFTPSNMKGQGRHFDKEVFNEKSKSLIYVIVSNVNFPEIKVRFVKGPELVALYPNGVIPKKDHDKFFSGVGSP
jgi:hypothetical protein